VSRLPRRTVTRFFIPMIDVLILLFCIFLLMPFVSGPTTPDVDPDKKTPPPTENLPTDVKELQRQLAEANLRLERIEKTRAKLADRLSVRVMEIDKRDGTLYYFDPDRVEVKTEADALRLITRQKYLAGQKDVFFLMLYPREPSGFPLRTQIDTYHQWFKDVPHGFDNPLSGS
jgi:hypothetical protein